MTLDFGLHNNADFAPELLGFNKFNDKKTAILERSHSYLIKLTGALLILPNILLKKETKQESSVLLSN